jgi:hypothetical protein
VRALILLAVAALAMAVPSHVQMRRDFPMTPPAAQAARLF